MRKLSAMRPPRSPALLLATLLLAGCGTHEHSNHASAGGGEGGDPGHVHVAPHGGLLVVLAEEGLHLEILRQDDQTLRAWVLGGHAEKPVRIQQPTIELQLRWQGGEQTLTLDAIESKMTGETLGDTAEFAASTEGLPTGKPLAGILSKLTARGATFEKVTFELPATP